MTTFNRRQTLATMGAGPLPSGGRCAICAQGKKITWVALALYQPFRHVRGLSARSISNRLVWDVEIKFFQAAQPMAVGDCQRRLMSIMP